MNTKGAQRAATFDELRYEQTEREIAQGERDYLNQFNASYGDYRESVDSTEREVE